MNCPVVWSDQARTQFLSTLAHIAAEDPLSAELVHTRVAKSLALLSESPAMGSPAAVAGVRSYAVPRTGHSLDYRLVRGKIRIQRWYRQRQQRAAPPKAD